MSILVTLVVLLVVFSLIYWLITSAPIPGPHAPLIKWALAALFLIFVIAYLLKLAPGIHLP